MPTLKTKKIKKKLILRNDLNSKATNIVMPSTKVYNEEFINILSELADIMTRSGEQFRARAYNNAVESIMMYPEAITSVDQIKDLPGIGKTIVNKLNEYVKDGKLKAIEKLKADPITLLTKVYGIGPKKAKKLKDDGIDTIEKLAQHPELLTNAQQIGVKYFNDIEKDSIWL